MLPHFGDPDGQPLPGHAPTNIRVPCAPPNIGHRLLHQHQMQLANQVLLLDPWGKTPLLDIMARRAPGRLASVPANFAANIRNHHHAERTKS